MPRAQCSWGIFQGFSEVQEDGSPGRFLRPHRVNSLCPASSQGTTCSQLPLLPLLCSRRNGPFSNPRGHPLKKGLISGTALGWGTWASESGINCF